jgi:bifunctional non-homologous end joining protein LigD
VDIRERGSQTKPYTVIRDAAGLVSLVQHGVLEFHLWGARADNVEAPDRMVFDLDPAPVVSWERVRAGARALRALLEDVGLESWIKTTGGKGIHVVVPIARRSTWEEVSGFARALAERMAREAPGEYLARASKAARKGKIFVDWLRNTRGATAVAPWSSRARPTAPVSAPIAWEELDRLTSGDQFHVADVPALISRRTRDPWRGMLASKQRLTRSMTARLEA